MFLLMLVTGLVIPQAHAFADQQQSKLMLEGSDLTDLADMRGGSNATDTGGGGGNSSRWISFWFSCDATYPKMLEAVAAHPHAVSSVILDCGMSLGAEGTVITPANPNCLPAIRGLAKLGVKAELAVGLGNSSIVFMRRAFDNGAAQFSEQLLRLVDAYQVQGIDFDWEPQPGVPQGKDVGNLKDAQRYAAFLAGIRKQLAGAGRAVRLTICVADWSPVMGQFALLAPAVDRLLDMETYNDHDFATWHKYYGHMVKPSVPRDKVGIGMYPFAKNGTWAASPASVAQRMQVISADGVPEVFIFRFLFENPPMVWPFDMWWALLQHFLAA